MSPEKGGPPKRLAAYFTVLHDAARLLHVFPEFLLQQVGEDEQYAEHEEHDDADGLALGGRRLAYVDQEIDDVAGGRVVLDLRQRAWRELRPPVLEPFVSGQVFRRLDCQ